jgi:hypothetical protein
MSAPVPTTEPHIIVAGDTLAFTKVVPNYTPGDGWTLNYALQGKTLAGSYSASPITFSSSTNTGSTWSISVAKTTTSAYAPGDYRWTAYVTGGTSERYAVGSGDVTILPDPSAAVPTSHAVRTLALIEAAMEGRIPRGLEQTIIDGQTLIRIPIPELSRLRDKYRAEVKAEQNAARVAAGLPTRRNSFARFRKP